MTAYLDNSATTRPSEAVIAAMEHCMREGFYNPSSLYAPAMEAEKQLKRARAVIEEILHAPAGQLLFTSGGTEANNLALMGSVEAMYGMRHLAVSRVEHPSVLEAARALERLGHRLSLIRVDGTGEPDWAQVQDLLERDPPDLISMMQVNNETGAVLDVRKLSELARRLSPGTLLHLDGVQGFLRLPTDARLFDLYTLSAHKIHGPKGVGALWVRKGVRLAPRQLGGDQEDGLRSGTENTPGIAGLLAAVERYPASAAKTMMELKMRLLKGMRERVPDLKVNGPDPGAGAPHILNLSFPGIRGEVLLHALEAKGVYVSTGAACSSKKRKVSGVLSAMGIPLDVAEGALRFSLCPDTRESQIDYACRCTGELYDTLKRFRRK